MSSTPPSDAVGGTNIVQVQVMVNKTKNSNPYVRIRKKIILKLSNIPANFTELRLSTDMAPPSPSALYLQALIIGLEHDQMIEKICDKCMKGKRKEGGGTFLGPIRFKDGRFPLAIHRNTVTLDFTIECNHERPRRPLKFCYIQCNVRDGCGGCLGGVKTAFMLNSGSGSIAEQKSDSIKFWDILSSLPSHFLVVPDALSERGGKEANIDDCGKKRKRTKRGESAQPFPSVSTFEEFRESVIGCYKSKVSPAIVKARPLTTENLKWLFDMCNSPAFGGSFWKFGSGWLEPTFSSVSQMEFVYVGLGAQNRVIPGFLSREKCKKLLEKEKAKTGIIRWSRKFPGSLVIDCKRENLSTKHWLLERQQTAFEGTHFSFNHMKCSCFSMLKNLFEEEQLLYLLVEDSKGNYRSRSLGTILQQVGLKKKDSMEEDEVSSLYETEVLD